MVNRSNCRIPCHFEAVPLDELDTRLRGERRPQPFSRNVKYISGCIRGYAVGVAGESIANSFATQKLCPLRFVFQS